MVLCKHKRQVRSVHNKMKFTIICNQNRVLLWILLGLLSTTLLLFPVQHVNEYTSIQAPNLFEKLPLFGFIFCTWMLTLILLVFFKNDKGNRIDCENLILATIFGLVFLGFWVIITPHGSFADGIFNMGHVNWLVNEGGIATEHHNLFYFDYPGMHLLSCCISQMSGMDVFEVRTVFLLINIVLFSALTYLFFTKILKSNRFAFLCVLLLMMGSVFLVKKMHIFTPGAWGYTLFIAVLVILVTTGSKFFGAKVADRVLVLILFAAMVVSYFASPLLVPLVLVGIFVVQTAAGDNKSRISSLTISLFLLMVVGWGTFWTWKIYGNLTVFLPDAWESLKSGEFTSIPLTLAKSNVGSSLPLWATLTRLFWWILLGFSTFIGLYKLVRVKRLGWIEKIIIGGLIGVIILTLIGVFGTHGGQQFTRFLLYAPIFSFPVLLMFLSESGRGRRIGSTLLIVLVFALGLPTFLSAVNLVGTEAIRSYDLKAGEFLQKSSKDDEDLIVYSPTYVATAWVPYYVPGAELHWVTEKTFYEESEDQVWKETEELATKFKARDWAAQNNQKVFIRSEKDLTFYQHLLAVYPDNPKWEALDE